MKYFVVLWALLSLGAGPALARVQDPAAAADRLLEPMAPDRPGAVVLVARGPDILYSRAFGAADLEQGTPIKGETRFHVASVSKQFTALAVALLAHEGRISLNADIRSYLPELPDFGSRVSVADLLHHTSGLRDQWDLLVLSGTDMQSLLTQKAILSLVLAQRGLNFAPGSEYRYSNTGYSLAAEIVARVSGMPFRRFVEERIFGPLGMTSSLIYDNAAEIVPGRANSYSGNSSGPVEHRRLNYSNYGATSMITTAGDLLKWSRELLSPRLFDAALLRSLHEPARLTDGSHSNYGLGMYRAQVRGRDGIMHGGSDAGFRSLIATYPAEGVSIVILSNGSADMVRLHEGLVDIFLNGGGAPPATIEPPPEELARLAGYYASGWGPGLELKVENGRLIRTAGGLPAPATFMSDGTIEFPTPPSRFRIAEAGISQVTAIEERTVSGPPVRYRRVEKAAVAPSELQALAGRYRSEELDITYRLAFDGGRLTLATLQSPEPIALTPVRRDWLDMPFGRLRVVRAPGGRPAAILVTTGRARNLRFDRVDQTAPGGRPST
jgi:CubicO group peptidase (beta-lactamase class C family)